MRERSLSRTPLMVETAEGIITDEPAGLVYQVNVNGRVLYCRLHAGIIKAPIVGDRVAIQISPRFGIGLIIAKVT